MILECAKRHPIDELMFNLHKLRMVALRNFVFVLCLIFSVASAERTVDEIFENIDKNYNKNVMPPSRRGQPVMVGITVSSSYHI